MTPAIARFSESNRYPIVLDTDAGPVGMTVHEATELVLGLIKTIKQAQAEREKQPYPRFLIKEIKNERTAHA